ncbi:MAG: hypothetical protein OXB88_01625 [Bacteriovoracales bacterium]|nr:hypothetical protein [Bacteriovoracales bacterium]
MAQSQRKDTSFEEIRKILREVSQNQKETDRRMKETDRRMMETDRQMKETDRQMKETDRRMMESDRRLNNLNDLFTGQWGKLMESLVEGELVNLLKERGVKVEHTTTRAKGQLGDRHWEIDILAVNGDEVVAVEVKTTLRVEHIDKFVEFLKDFKDLLKEYKDKKTYGAVAYLKADQAANIYAEKQGLYVIRATGNSAKIINNSNFKARKF